MVALKGWPIVGFIPQLLKAMSNKGYNEFYHKLQQKLGPIFKMKGLGISIACNQLDTCPHPPRLLLIKRKIFVGSNFRGWPVFKVFAV